MNNWIPSLEFEEKIRKSFQIPEARSEFIMKLQSKLESMETGKPARNSTFRNLRPAWTIGIVLVMLVILASVIIGPQQVLAAIGRLFGYIPGVGIVDEDQAFRVLAEPVSVTRDGVTITITDVLLTDKKTVVLYSIEGVKWESFSHDENVHGCISMPELRLTNGKNLSIWQGSAGMGKNRLEFPPVEPDINRSQVFPGLYQ